MTEAEWLECKSPQPIMKFLTLGQATERKRRMFAVACCRSVLFHCSKPQFSDMLLAFERYADGLVNEPVRSSARRAIHVITQQSNVEDANNAAAWAIYWAGGKRVDLLGCCMNCALVIGRAMQRDAKTIYGDQSAAWLSGREIEASRQADLFRDIFGNPFRQVTLNPSWLTAAVVQLAQLIYDERAFERMAEVADALEQAGCSNSDIVQHCRGPGPHVRGCWVVDLILGKE